MNDTSTLKYTTKQPVTVLFFVLQKTISHIVTRLFLFKQLSNGALHVAKVQGIGFKIIVTLTI